MKMCNWGSFSWHAFILWIHQYNINNFNYIWDTTHIFRYHNWCLKDFWHILNVSQFYYSSLHTCVLCCCGNFLLPGDFLLDWTWGLEYVRGVWNLQWPLTTVLLKWSSTFGPLDRIISVPEIVHYCSAHGNSAMFAIVDFNQPLWDVIFKWAWEDYSVIK